MGVTVNLRRAVRRSAGIFIAMVLLTAPAVVLASHQFNDVPNDHPFHGDISAVALAGIANGFPDGGYHPSEAVTRQAMAAFLRRGLGRVAGDTGSSITVPAATLVTVAETAITPGVASGALAGANGFLKIDGSVTLYEGVPDNCICSISLRVYVNNVAVPGTQYVFLPRNTIFESGSASINVVVPVTAGAKTVSLRVNEYQGDETLVAYATLSVLYVPFGSTGTDT